MHLNPFVRSHSRLHGAVLGLAALLKDTPVLNHLQLSSNCPTLQMNDEIFRRNHSNFYTWFKSHINHLWLLHYSGIAWQCCQRWFNFFYVCIYSERNESRTSPNVPRHDLWPRPWVTRLPLVIRGCESPAAWCNEAGCSRLWVASDGAIRAAFCF